MKNFIHNINRLLSVSFVVATVMLLLVPPANFANAQGERPVVCQDLTLDFDGLAHGAPLGNRDGTDPGTIHAKLVPFGIRASAMAMDPQTQPPRGVNTLIVYDSHFPNRGRF